MARLPPLWQQNSAFPASVDRRLIGALWPVGGVDGMAPTVMVGTMQLQLASGAAVVPDSRVIGAAYLCASDAAELVTLSAAPPSGQDRIDLVVVRPRDSAYTGADNDWIFDPIAGVPAANPSVPAVPAGTIPIAQQRVVGGAASIIGSNLVDRRIGGLSARDVRNVAATATPNSELPTADTWYPVTGYFPVPAGAAVYVAGYGQFFVAPAVNNWQDIFFTPGIELLNGARTMGRQRQWTQSNSVGNVWQGQMILDESFTALSPGSYRVGMNGRRGAGAPTSNQIQFIYLRATIDPRPG